MITSEGIRATGLYLLELLKAVKVVRYSRFYNEMPETEEQLAANVGSFIMDDRSCNVEDVREEGHVMLEFAAWQLKDKDKDLGLVRIGFVDERLIDDEQDFQISLTEKGERVNPRSNMTSR